MSLSPTAAPSEPLDLLVLEGDGIGPEITSATLQVLDAAAQRFGFTLSIARETIGFSALRKIGTTFACGA